MPHAEDPAWGVSHADGPCVAIDFETSGRPAHYACAVGLVRIEAGTVTARFESLLRPPSPRVWFTHIHGLRWSDLKDQPTFAEVWPGASRILRGARCLLAHSAQFDRRVLYACCRVAGLEPPAQPFLCTLRGARRAPLDLPSRSLNHVCAHFGIPLNHHNAASDAEGCALIYVRLRELGVSDAVMRI
ncbi:MULTISPECIES: exonuclease domain-containing protein [unclassified Desulfovibrio]|uniref:exonuclease domain-containing protein n=1 Tax=unclassified Desulfovibrio TaxID=2593640 RepID=UPI00197F6776|nr:MULTISPECIES: exonuclease domain-containing protein [unclassified Desulfovibrio]